MTYDEGKSEWVFTSGRRVYAHSDIIGLDCDASWVSYGCDGGLANLCRLGDESDLNPGELMEIATELVARASRFLSSVQKLSQNHENPSRF